MVITYPVITLAVPTNRLIQAKTVESLARLVAHGNYTWHIVIAERGYTVAENRNYCVVKALNNNSDYILFIDDDMTFEPDLLDRLIANDKDIVGVAFHPRTDMQDRLKWLDETHYISLEKNTDPKYKKTFECHATGTGIILIKCEVFRKVPRPWFMFEYYETGQVKLGEDWFWCRAAKKAGYKIYTDPEIKVGHVGEKQF